MGMTPGPTAAPVVTPAKFLEEYPLYREWKTPTWNMPGTISFDCSTCEKETTWEHQSDDSNSNSFFLLGYRCHLCQQRSTHFLVVRLEHGVMKVGQFPMQSTRVPSRIEKRLGNSANFYRRALTSRNEGYGIGAVAYFRRVIEDKTNELIDVVADAARAYGISEPDIEKIRAAKNQKVYEDKLKIAAQAIPDVLKPDTANPLQALYDTLSVGIHTQSEDECLKIADEIRDVFDYLFDRLRTEIEDRTSFVNKVKSIVSKRGQGIHGKS